MPFHNAPIVMQFPLDDHSVANLNEGTAIRSLRERNIIVIILRSEDVLRFRIKSAGDGEHVDSIAVTVGVDNVLSGVQIVIRVAIE